MANDVTDALSPAPLSAPVRRGHPLIAWGAIAVAVVTLAVLRWLFPSSAEAKQSDALELQGRFLVGAANLPGPKPSDLYDQAKELDIGSPGQRLRFRRPGGRTERTGGGPAAAGCLAG